MTRLTRGIGRLIDSYAEGVIDKTEFEPRLAGFRQRLAGLEEQRRALDDCAGLEATLSMLLGRLEAFAVQVRDRLTGLDWLQRRELIRLLVKRVEIKPDEVNVVFRVAPSPCAPSPGSHGEGLLPDCWGRWSRRCWPTCTCIRSIF
jgi:site-specific DNA recombinase